MKYMVNLAVCMDNLDGRTWYTETLGLDEGNFIEDEEYGHTEGEIWEAAQDAWSNIHRTQPNVAAIGLIGYEELPDPEDEDEDDD